MTVSRREIQFNEIDDIAGDVRMLLSCGYESAGKWNLAQACTHMEEWMRYPMDGFPKPPLPIKLILLVLRKTIGPGQFRKMVAKGEMPAGNPTDPRTVAEPDAASDSDAVEQLCQTIERFKSYGGPLYPSPLFGNLTKSELTQLNQLHCALHLSFLVPKAE